MKIKHILFFSLFLLSFDLVAQTQEQWAPRNIGPAGMSGRITAIDVVLDNAKIWYVGTASGGLWKTTNDGTTFKPIFDDQPVQSIGAVSVFQPNPSIVWAGTGEGNPRNSQNSGAGIYKSLDAGKTWQLMGLELTRNIHRVITHPTDPNVLWVGAQGNPYTADEYRGVYKTTDGGQTWRKVLGANNETGVAELRIDPTNPNKLFAALWQLQRTPWDMTSGGEGSGLFVSVDGGETWSDLSEKGGLPEKPYGRIGIAVAPSNPEVIYTLIENQKNAMYKSEDGGDTWTMINEKTIGSRPFYFADLYVDPKNENRLYNLYSRLAKSENGGKDFEVIEDWGFEVHADHQAFWIHPEDPDFIIDGTDGGLYWTKDGATNWRFAENLPLGQFYHVTLDNEYPYNVYGGLQDNGTWYGPNKVWNRGGLRNGYWKELAFNDGFDVAIDAQVDYIVYALWQGGMLVRINKETGQRKTIRPADPDRKLRFNWNAAIAADPFQSGTVYLGSQFVHRSTDFGDSWEIISPDLTTNDPKKQQQLTSGGLSIDATTAENHTALVSIAPSPIKKGVIWTGSDDGKVHLTKDGGATWVDLTRNINSAPQAGWITQIVPSTYDVQAAFVVIDNHRQGDWAPYVFKTKDGGKSWKNLLLNKGIDAFALSFVQHPKTPSLMFVGTEFGLYYSINAGEAWNKWEVGFPSVATTDLKIHPRENDLVMATFGRSFWVLDDLWPLEELASSPSIRNQSAHLFKTRPAYQAIIDQAIGQRLTPAHMFTGDNLPKGATLTYWLAQSDSVELQISRDGEMIYIWKERAEEGINRTYWNLEKAGKSIYGPLMSPVIERPLVAPGEYTVYLNYGDQRIEQSLTVGPDPRIDYNAQAFSDNEALRDRLEDINKAKDSLLDSLKYIEMMIDKYEDESSQELTENITQKVEEVWSLIAYRNVQGAISDSPRLEHQIGKAFYYMHSPYEPITDNDKEVISNLEGQLSDVQLSYNTELLPHWMEFKKVVGEKWFEF
ncbi:MAG: hypothetical protein RIF33_01405 [Cyclobacteriaceae bacterium]